jgi:hypothetical protein
VNLPFGLFGLHQLACALALQTYSLGCLQGLTIFGGAVWSVDSNMATGYCFSTDHRKTKIGAILSQCYILATVGGTIEVYTTMYAMLSSCWCCWNQNTVGKQKTCLQFETSALPSQQRCTLSTKYLITSKKGLPPNKEQSGWSHHQRFGCTHKRRGTHYLEQVSSRYT